MTDRKSCVVIDDLYIADIQLLQTLEIINQQFKSFFSKEQAVMSKLTDDLNTLNYESQTLHENISANCITLVIFFTSTF